MPRSTIVPFLIACLVGLGQDPSPSTPGVSVTISCARQAVGATELFPIKLTVAAETASISFLRNDLVSPKSLVAASYDRKGHWVTTKEPEGAEVIALHPGESFAMDIRVRLPEPLTANPSGAILQWVGSGRLSGLRSNELNLSVRAETNPTATLETSEGTIVVELWPDKAPNHVANFLTLAKNGFYDGRIFHRVIANFMIQTGCPLGTGLGDPGYKIAAEFNDAPFVKGTLGMARSQSNDSAGSQFFICVADHHDLDNKYTAFGRVIEGQDVADKISMVPRDTQKGDRPFKDVPMKKVTSSLGSTYTLPEVKKVGDPDTKPAAGQQASESRGTKR